MIPSDFTSITGKAVDALNSASNTALIIFGFFLVLVIIMAIRHVLDIAIDLWKIPFAMIVDFIDFYSASYWALNIVTAAVGIGVFWILSKRGHHVGKIFGIVVAAEAFIGQLYLTELGIFANILPISTLLMFFAIKAD